MNLLQKNLILLSLAVLLSACGGTSENAVDTSTTDTSNRITISGSVGDGPIVGAAVNVKNRHGVVLATTTSDPQANYALSVDTQSDDFPLTLEAINGIDLVTGTSPDFTLLSVLPDALTEQANLNPHSTAIVKTAWAMAGGLNETNLAKARLAVLEKLNFGLDTDLVADPIEATVDDTNIVVMTHASETLAEMVRRTSKALGGNATEDTVFDALAADLTDGNLDGLGSAGTDPRYTAVSQAVGLQVLIETMLHDLHVNGLPADDALTAAIETTMATSNRSVIQDGSTRIKRRMIRQAMAALAAVRAIDNRDIFIRLLLAIQDLGDESDTQGLTEALTNHGVEPSVTDSIDDSIDQVVGASDDEIDDINNAANEVDDGTSGNQAPVISGNPASSVAEGEAYSFTPSASDADGDSLSFSISNQPAWANFNASNGTLSGMPGFTDAGEYINISISVTDGTASASLSPFSISVGGSNRAPNINGIPGTQATEGQPYSFTPSASDPDGDGISFNVANLPAWASFDSSTGTLSGTPGFSDAGIYGNIVISVSDGAASASLLAFDISVQDSNRTPSIGGNPITSVAEAAAYAFTPTASDPDGDTLSFTATNLPVWASFDSTNGSLSGTPGYSDAGAYNNIVISVSDGTASASLGAFSITVTHTDENPTPDPVAGAPTLISANLSGASVVLVWNQNNAVPEGGYDIILDGVDTNDQYRTTLLTSTIPGMDLSVSHCFAIQARYTATNEFLNSNELCTQAVTPNNNAPTISGTPNPNAAEGGAYLFTPSAADADGDTLTFSITGRPAWASFNVNNGTLSGTPGFTDAGSYNNIVISVSDGTATASLNAFSINVTETNRSPSISGSPASSVTEGALYSFTPSASDADGNALSFSISNLPVWASFNSSNGTLSGTPGFSDAGVYSNIVISVSDGIASASLNPFNISVGGSNRTPSISGTPGTLATEGQTYSFTPSASDPDGDTISFSVANLPAWASFNSSNGTLSGTPTYSDAGNYTNIVISASDGSASASLNAFSISVEDINRTPSISGTPASNVAEGAVYTFAPTATDPDGDTLSFTASNVPAWASFNSTNGTLSGTPGFDDAGSYNNILIQISDGTATASLSAFSINVTETNRAPTISGTPAANVTETAAYNFAPSATDPDADSLSFSISNLPSWASFNSATGTLTGTPGYTDAGTYSGIVIQVSDGTASAALGPFGINVTNSNRVPSISGAPATSVAEGAAYSFTPSATDPDGDTLTFSIIGRPSWASFNTTNGTLSGTPGFDDAGSYGNISISVTDGTATTSLSAFSINVSDTNRAPTISGSPASSVTEGELYSFTPISADLDGDTLSFSATNLPAWASLDAASGRLFGTPGATDVGSYVDIVIRVTDGKATAAMSPISIQVNAASATTGSANLTWSIPSTRIDGSPLALSEIAGYRIYIGSSSDNLALIVDLNDGAATSYTVTDLAPGTYYFSITTYDADGVESSYSNITQKTIL